MDYKKDIYEEDDWRKRNRFEEIYYDVKKKAGQIYDLLILLSFTNIKEGYHTFIANIRGGSVFVDCGGDGIVIESTTRKDGIEKVKKWTVDAIDGTAILLKIDIDLSSVELL